MKFTIKYGWTSKDSWAWCDLDRNEITLNIDLYLATMYLHEACHLLHPEWSERRVVVQTERLITRLKVQQIKDLARGVRRKVSRK